MSETETPREAGLHALKQAQAAARKGDAMAAERWSKTAQRMAAAAERLAKLPAPVPDHEDEEALRAELRRRLALYVEAAQAEADDETFDAIDRESEARWENRHSGCSSSPAHKPDRQE